MQFLEAMSMLHSFSSPVEGRGVTGHLSICMWNLRAFPTIHEGVRPLRFVPSSTGLPSKRCPSIGFLSRADTEIGVFRHVAPTTRLRLEFPRETGLILRCAGKVRKPFQTKQGNRPSRRDQEGIRGSEQAVPHSGFDLHFSDNE